MRTVALKWKGKAPEQFQRCARRNPRPSLLLRPSPMIRFDPPRRLYSVTQALTSGTR
jgi:hypothetical protein